MGSEYQGPKLQRNVTPLLETPDHNYMPQISKFRGEEAWTFKLNIVADDGCFDI